VNNKNSFPGKGSSDSGSVLVKVQKVKAEKVW